MLDLLGLPADASFGLPTGAGLGNAVGLAAGRHAVLARAGWDVEADGLYGAPEIAVVVGEEAHATLLTALQYLGLGRDRVTRVPADDQGRMRADAAREAIASAGGPLLVAIQAGNVNTGAFDPAGEIADAVAAHPNAWLHVDGAFGLWAAASPRLRHLVTASIAPTRGRPTRTSGSTSATTVASSRRATPRRTAPRCPHRRRISCAASSARTGSGCSTARAAREASPSTRPSVRSGARGSGRSSSAAATWRHGMADRLRAADGVEVLNDVVLNQVLVRFGDDERTRDVIARVQADGTAWMGGTTWRGAAAMRISVSNWSTTEADADRTVDAILRAAHEG